MNFNERQRFTQWWIWVILLLIPGVAALSFWYGEDYNYAEFLVFLLPLATIIMFMLMKLDTRINQEGIMFRFFPFQFGWKKIAKEDIEKAYVRKYHPIREYGGWGVRFGYKTGRAFNVRGNTGIQLELRNGEKILLGTQQPKDADKVLKALGFTGILS